jgi:hypothetical protein
MAYNSKFGSNIHDESISSIDEGVISPKEPHLVENTSKSNLMMTMADLDKVKGYDPRRLNMEEPKPW